MEPAAPNDPFEPLRRAGVCPSLVAKHLASAQAFMAALLAVYSADVGALSPEHPSAALLRQALVQMAAVLPQAPRQRPASAGPGARRAARQGGGAQQSPLLALPDEVAQAVFSRIPVADVCRAIAASPGLARPALLAATAVVVQLRDQRQADKLARWLEWAGIPSARGQDGLRELPACRSLRRLELRLWYVQGYRIALDVGTLAGLEELGIIGGMYTDVALALWRRQPPPGPADPQLPLPAIAALRGLTRLRIDAGTISLEGAADGLAQLSLLTGLRSLQLLSASAATVAIGSELGQLTALTELSVRSADMTAADGLAQLSRLTGLRRLQLNVKAADLQPAMLGGASQLTFLGVYASADVLERLPALPALQDLRTHQGLPLLAPLWRPQPAQPPQPPQPLAVLEAAATTLTRLDVGPFTDGGRLITRLFRPGRLPALRALACMMPHDGPFRVLPAIECMVACAPGLEELRLQCEPRPDSGMALAALSALQGLTKLYLYSEAGTEAFTALAGLTGLRHLTVQHYTHAADVVKLTALTNLRTLDLKFGTRLESPPGSPPDVWLRLVTRFASSGAVDADAVARALRAAAGPRLAE